MPRFYTGAIVVCSSLDSRPPSRRTWRHLFPEAVLALVGRREAHIRFSAVGRLADDRLLRRGPWLDAEWLPSLCPAAGRVSICRSRSRRFTLSWCFLSNTVELWIVWRTHILSSSAMIFTLVFTIDHYRGRQCHRRRLGVYVVNTGGLRLESRETDRSLDVILKGVDRLRYTPVSLEEALSTGLVLAVVNWLHQRHILLHPRLSLIWMSSSLWWRLDGIFKTGTSPSGKIEEFLEFVTQCADSPFNVALRVVVVAHRSLPIATHLIIVLTVGRHL